MSDYGIDRAIEGLGHRWGCGIDNFRLIHRHVDKAAYYATYPDGKRVIVKVDLRRERYCNELLMLELAHAHGLPVPEVVFTDDGDFGLTVLTHLPGAALVLQDSIGCVNTGSLLRQLHSLPPNRHLRPFSGSDGSWAGLLQRYRDEVKRFVGLGLFDANLMQRLQALVERGLEANQVPTMTIIHGDLQRFHVLLEPNSHQVTGLLDLADAGLGDPLWDIAVLTSRGDVCTTNLLQGYGADDALRARADSVLPAYRVVRWMGEVRWRRVHGVEIGRQLRHLGMAATTSTAF